MDGAQGKRPRGLEREDSEAPGLPGPSYPSPPTVAEPRSSWALPPLYALGHQPLSVTQEPISRQLVRSKGRAPGRRKVCQDGCP